MHILTSTIAHLTLRVSPSSEGTLTKGMKYNSRRRLWGRVEPRTQPILWNIKLSVCRDQKHSLLTTSTNGAAPWNIAPLAWTHLTSDEDNNLTLVCSDSQYIHHFIVNKGDGLGGTCHCTLVKHSMPVTIRSVRDGFILTQHCRFVSDWRSVIRETQYVLFWGVF